MGKSEMEDYLEAAAAKQGRTLTQEDRPEAGYYYRSDHSALPSKVFQHCTLKAEMNQQMKRHNTENV